MNLRNIKALGDALFEALGREYAPSIAMAVARRIIDTHGVLVPSVLTDTEVADLFDVPESHAANRRADLEQLAKGESP